MMVYDDLVESLIKRRQLFYVIKIELQKPTSVGGMWMYTPHTFQIHQTAIIRLPPFAVNTWIFGIKYFPLTCWICLGHIDITTSAYTYGQGNPGGLSIRHSFNTSDYPKEICLWPGMLIIYEEDSRH